MIKQINGLKARFQTILNRTLNKFYAFWDAGETVLCELCLWKGKKFRNSLCPNCNSKPRHRLIPYAFRWFNLNSDKDAVLHIAPNAIERFWGERHFVDNYIRLNLNYSPEINLRGDLTKIPLNDKTIDLVILWHVLEHIPEDIKALSEINRVLKKNGKALISVPIYPPDRQKTYENKTTPKEKYNDVFGHPDHVRACGLDYKERLKDLMWTVSELRVGDMVKREDICRYGLSSSHVVWMGLK